MKKSSKTPPSLATKLLIACTDYDEEFNIVDTLQELYCYTHESNGRRKANFWYWKHVLYSIPKNHYARIKWSFIMFKNHMKIALRNFYKHKSYSFINISGLAIGMACCMLIMLWVHDELNYEKFNKNIDNIFCVVNYSLNEANSNSRSLPALLIPHLKENYADIKHASRYKAGGRRLFSYKGNNVFEDNGGFGDPELFDIFSFKAVVNDPKAALMDVNTIILTKSMAERFFAS